MTDVFNPYQAPDAPVAEEFIAVEPIRRPTANFISAAVCFGCAAFVLSIEVLFIWATIDLWSRAGTKFENHPTHLGWREFLVVPIGLSGFVFLLSGRSFWLVRNRLGVHLFLAALGIFASTFLVPFLVPRLFP